MITTNYRLSSDSVPENFSTDSVPSSISAKSKFGLVIDTGVSRHAPVTPRPVVPIQPKQKRGAGFISLRDVEALRTKKYTTVTSRNETKVDTDDSTHLRRGPRRTVEGDVRVSTKQEAPERPRSNAAPLLDPTPKIPQTEQPTLLSEMRMKLRGLSLASSNFSIDVSPSDRAIPIGLAVSSDSSFRHTHLSQSTTYSGPSTKRQPSQRLAGGPVTPTIVVTPAEETFTFDASQRPAHAPTSSRDRTGVYSQQQADSPSDVPPVPPLPSFSDMDMSPHESAGPQVAQVARFQKGAKKYKNKIPLSIRTELEREHSVSQRQGSDNRRMTSQSLVPTPRRSRGWWNVIISPFALTPKRGNFFGRSNSEEDDGEDLVRNAQEMGTEKSLYETTDPSRLAEGDSPQSAPPTDTQKPSPEFGIRPLKRSDTAPAALDPNSSQLNIYRVPSQGEAAAYYDPLNRFHHTNAARGGPVAEDLQGWSPSQSVFRRSRARALSMGESIGSDGVEPEAEVTDRSISEPTRNEDAMRNLVAAENERGGVNDEEEGNDPHNMISCFSPDSPTTTIIDSRPTTMMSPSSFYPPDEPVPEVPPNFQRSIGLGVATMASRNATEKPKAPTIDEGMSMHSSSDVEEEPRELDLQNGPDPLDRAPTPVSEKLRFKIKKFSQMRFDTEEDKPNRRPWYRRFFWFLAVNAGALLILVLVLLVVYIPQSYNIGPVEAEWLDLTGFPPIPTGVMTIIQPTNINDVNGCVAPSALWSCAMPAAEGTSTSSPIPDFRLEILFRNQTDSQINATDLQTALGKRATRVRAARRSVIRKRDLGSDLFFTPSPPPPSTEDQSFLGRTTDDISAPYDGEETPFFLTLLDPQASKPASSPLFHERRDVNQPSSHSSSPASQTSQPATPSTKAHTTLTVTSTSTSTFTSTLTPISSSVFPSQSTETPTSNSSLPEGPTTIPSPATQSNGQPIPPVLYPFVQAQPLRLYNRGQESEHYGFYTYFSRTVYISTTNESTPKEQANPPLSKAAAVCTWTQTRLVVKIWTRKGTVTSLPSSSSSTQPNSTATPSNSDSPLSGANTPASNSTANVLQSPGSFPYRVTIALDRHGGDASEKGVYCYGLDAKGEVIVPDAKSWIAEDRGFGGDLVRPAQVPVPASSSRVGSEKRSFLPLSDGDGVGVDGGSGGCACGWSN